MSHSAAAPLYARHHTDEEFYSALIKESASLISGERDLIANCANISSLVYNALNERRGAGVVNWVGFYFVRPAKTAHGSQLVLGPFMGILFSIYCQVHFVIHRYRLL